MTRTDIINAFIEKRGYKSYLEIGVFHGENFREVNCEWKTGVDPRPHFKVKGLKEIIIPMTSDEYFDTAKSRHNFPIWDIIFIDGDHREEQVEKDIKNSLKFLNKDGVILLHDCNPPTEEHARPEYTQGTIAEWNGTVYKAWINFRMENNWKTYTIDTDWGVGVIDTSNSLPSTFVEIADKPFDWEDFNKNRKYYLNLISPADFLNKLNEN